MDADEIREALDVTDASSSVRFRFNFLLVEGLSAATWLTKSAAAMCFFLLLLPLLLLLGEAELTFDFRVAAALSVLEAPTNLEKRAVRSSESSDMGRFCTGARAFGSADTTHPFDGNCRGNVRPGATAF